jgi:hypothetical protein
MCFKLYFTHYIPPTCFGHSCGHSQGGALQRMDNLRYCKICEIMHRCKILSFEKQSLKCILKSEIQVTRRAMFIIHFLTLMVFVVLATISSWLNFFCCLVYRFLLKRTTKYISEKLRIRTLLQLKMLHNDKRRLF